MPRSHTDEAAARNQRVAASFFVKKKFPVLKDTENLPMSTSYFMKLNARLPG